MKRIVVAFDGTTRYNVPSNVRRMCHALSCSSDGIQQLTFCQSGVGPEDLNSVGIVGLYAQDWIEGFDTRIYALYINIMSNYLPGDEIFIFGFSRGAFAARVLANFLVRVGIYREPEFTSAFPRALKAYKDGTLDRDIEAHKYHTTPGGEQLLKVYEVEIEVVGCWDTVASLGFPWAAGGISWEYRHYSPSLVKGIKHAFHAVALDEYRRPFSPTMWYLPKDAEVAKTIDLQQCWFPGAHRNVGGGYDDEALADLSFFWMLDRCRPFLNFDLEYIKYIVDAHHQPSEFKGISDCSSLLEPSDGSDTKYQGWGRGKCYNSYKIKHSWGLKYRTPGAYGDDNEETKETIHASVRARWQTSRESGGELKDGPRFYAPEALRGFEPRECANGSWEWVKKKKGKEVLVIPEASFPARPTLLNDRVAIPPKVSFEELLVHAPATSS
ncbi:hypothetical protein GYMLUDRAFT_207992 [Collybiopsis luxurians FD-317 M1]|uniref:T6SS Phospholipase effector Tle1-like catalytic domain-containing protein n=1 Tax=Collybiopsis luxurians FD-317 M1 TaxID=944289 RepID=A0A0D0BD27_9AGAR|nr:hypothetical protein GYMLUDRAFT_207992 [Collybiopsis luxurians FD-317 M1]